MAVTSWFGALSPALQPNEAGLAGDNWAGRESAAGGMRVIASDKLAMFAQPFCDESGVGFAQQTGRGVFHTVEQGTFA